ncbi:HTTM domain-containing protein [Candidatus Poriferisocius sp.]|uniref:HTTM domain-containing protein n=1 Tax=Candidatus Poriferisocius sp. TaxID=3101276 RepID=UPI003B5265B6
MTAAVAPPASADRRTRCRQWLQEAFDEPASVRGVAIVRIVLGPSVIWHLRPFLADALNGVTYLDVFQQKWWPWVPNAPAGLYMALLWIGVAAAVLMTVGLWSRAATWVTLAVVAYNFFLSETHFRHNRAFLIILLAGVALCDNGRVLSLDARRRQPLDDRALVWPVWLLRFEAAAIYFASGFSKLIDPDWVGGRVMHDRTLRYQDDAREVLGDTLGDPLLEVLTARAFQWVLSPVAVATELFIAFGLWFRRTRLAAVWVAVAFHVGIEVSAQVEVFSVIAIGALAIWATPSTRDRTLVTPSRWVRWLDWTARFDITVAPGASWRMVDRDGTVLEGQAARQFVRTRLPATFLFSRFWRYP